MSAPGRSWSTAGYELPARRVGRTIAVKVIDMLGERCG
jgi:hypothetical protein